jgi:phosphatidyl-myo-inositol dimannoside synthase
MHDRILFLTLKVFSSTGGIEKVCRIAGKALNELAIETNCRVKIHSMYDKGSEANDKYFPSDLFTGFGEKKGAFVLKSIASGIKSKIVILSHINLLFVGFVIKIFSPRTRIVLIAHGIEVWQALPWWKRKMLRQYNKIVAVSNYTKEKMQEYNDLDIGQISVLSNCLDPFLPSPDERNILQLKKKYAICENDKVLLTLTRLSLKERYKGYDKVLEAIQGLGDEFSDLKYLIVGGYDNDSKKLLDEHVDQLDLKAQVIITGFIPDEELADHYKLADLYIMPSIKEGFGIVFIEAMYYGLPVIAGNKDGSVDALANGELGLLVDPNDLAEIIRGIKKVLENGKAYQPDAGKLMANFSYESYKSNLLRILNELKN